MPKWDFNYRAGPKGGTMTALDTWATSVRALSEGSPELAGALHGIDAKHGAGSNPLKFNTTKDLMLEVAVRYTDAAGAITHTNGAAGHVLENLSELKRVLGGDRASFVAVRRDDPHWGEVDLWCEQLQPVAETQNRFVFLFPLTAASPFWRSTSPTTQSPPTITVGGNARCDNALVRFLTGTDPVFTHTPSGAEIGIEGAVPVGGVELDVATGTCRRISDGADWGNWLTVNKRWILELDIGANACTIAGGTCEVEVANQWK